MLGPNRSISGGGVPVPSKVTFIRRELAGRLSLPALICPIERRTNNEMMVVKESRIIIFY
jgi:hypothetical protein